ncbi:ATP-binding cassette domain-containing protein, partial [Patulibacter sp. NPDC049589]|uniref:ABC transporter ATP-binding protein/permease n=1 Tax=Patulibacter sp. NPDC049589 TaxID=3154731 RepID=UPI0034173160
MDARTPGSGAEVAGDAVGAGLPGRGAARRSTGTERPAGPDGEPTPRDVHRRLLALSRPARILVAGTVACGAVAAATIVVQAWVVADVIGAAVGGRGPETALLVVLGAAVLVRALAAGGTEVLGRRAAEHAAHALRVRIADRALAARGGTPDEARRGDVVTAAVQGVDALGDYYARAVPAIALAGAVPLAVVAAVAWRQPIIGGLLAVTLPILVIFMVLVGRASAEHARERQRALAVLGAHFLEVVRALPTLRAHGRERAQSDTLDAVAERYRAESLSALRVAFLSALILELFAMLGIAIAAATTGVLLATGHAELSTGLFVLLLAPEVYAPLRAAGQRFHAAEDGAQAARRAFAFLDEGAATEDTGPDAIGSEDAGPDAIGSEDAGRDAIGPAEDAGPGPVDPTRAAIVLHGVAVAGSAGRAPRLRALDLDLAPGRSVALVGTSGAGKTTLLHLLARMRDPDAGAITCGGVDLRAVAPEAWWRQLAWLPQRPGLPPGTLAEALRGAAGAAWTVDDRAGAAGRDDRGAVAPHGAGGPAVDGRVPAASAATLDDRIARALTLADADGVLASLPDGPATVVGPGGRVLSAGQTQRLALAGALASAAPLVLLDEPTAHLDADSARRVADGILRACAGRTLVVATHDPVLAGRCDVVVTLDAGTMADDRPPADVACAGSAPAGGPPGGPTPAGSTETTSPSTGATATAAAPEADLTGDRDAAEIDGGRRGEALRRVEAQVEP